MRTPPGGYWEPYSHRPAMRIHHLARIWNRRAIPEITLTPTPISGGHFSDYPAFLAGSEPTRLSTRKTSFGRLKGFTMKSQAPAWRQSLMNPSEVFAPRTMIFESGLLEPFKRSKMLNAVVS